MQNMWFFMALAAAICWGLSYALVEQVLKVYSTAFVMWLGGLVAFVGYSIALYFNGGFAEQMQHLRNGENAWLLVLNGVFFILGNYAILMAITSKNATLATMIEITYPLFTAMFALLLFKQNQLNPGTLAAGGVIITGVAMMYWFNRS